MYIFSRIPGVGAVGPTRLCSPPVVRRAPDPTLSENPAAPPRPPLLLGFLGALKIDAQKGLAHKPNHSLCADPK
jgi:hypothetical protein